MPLLIQRTGLEQYGSEGSAKLKALIIGGPGAGKTAWASFWPRPIYADVEGGLASVAHQQVPYVSVNNSQDMLDLLVYLRTQSEYDTVVIDTLDAYQRKLKTEWMARNKAESFTGFEAWNYLATKCQVLMTRLLNLDMNIVVNVHYKDKVLQSKDGDSTREVTQYMLQLQGETADNVFNDFDLVGWMERDFAAIDGKRQLRHTLSFTPTPDKPFLKDRLAITPKEMTVKLDPSGYHMLFAKLEEKIAGLSPTQQLAEIPTVGDNPPAKGVVAPGGVGGSVIGGAAEKVDQTDLMKMDVPTLRQIAREENVTKTADGSPVRGNTTKAELALAIREHRKAAASASGPDAAVTAVGDAPAAATPTPAPAATAVPAMEPSKLADNILARTRAAARPADLVDQTTGEVPDGVCGPEGSMAPDPTLPVQATPAVPYREAPQIEPVKTAEELLGSALGATPVEESTVNTEVPVETDEPEAQPAPATLPEPTPQPAAEPEARQAPQRKKPDLSKMNCAQCGKNLGDENPDYVRLSMIKLGRFLCIDDYRTAMKK